MNERETEAREALLVALARKYPNTSQNGIHELAKHTMHAVAVRSFIHANEPLNLPEVLAYAAASDLGQMIADAENRDSDEPDDGLAHLDTLTPEERINWARANGHT
jgi:hypothetical protein